MWNELGPSIVSQTVPIVKNNNNDDDNKDWRMTSMLIERNRSGESMVYSYNGIFIMQPL